MDINQTIPSEIGVFNIIIASGPVIIQEIDGIKKVLLVKHGDKPPEELKWKFCGGKIIKGLSLEDNATKEAQEEIGVLVKLIKPLKPIIIWNEIPETGNEKPEAIILIHYLAEITEKPVKGQQTLAMEWFNIRNLPFDISANVGPVIAEYLSFIN